MKVVVCTKQTPSTTATFTVNNGVVSWDDPGGKPNVVNPWDEYAIEEAIRLKENHGAEAAIALTAGGESADDVLKTALAMGCTEAIRVEDAGFAGSGSRGTANILAAAIKKTGADIAFFGKQAIDGDTGLTPVMAARALGWTPLTYVSAIKSVSDDSITVERQIETGTQTVTAPLPVVISVVKEINEPRYPSFMGIRKASRATIPVWSAADLDIEGAYGPGSAKVDWSEITQPPSRDTVVEFISGDSAEEIAAALATKLFEEKVI
ncbi:MAG: electron transfer flavoprotein subunit beta/FixA family protein [Anaerolineae bacterium]|nr:electron transfer flavoprotein subunit beta/FixA family protein [Anaerolineae bacterium]MCO5187764.1 electron transfer flavoprotein subunit beta/FixA family protein [Anaerolineae bacterium]MCO5195829.1 electron transfer flavoprotein subunit beta/FixA family protein [Anaerolineae bacterium]MCO5196594.1 electron transfer flavoprotein subunit beta/FixA family protein [Anaerolineae bacterium]MCO5206581.1 electron transfer flavoprotein subunit beta/FixA family protein [Anaerolineae bacterium]